MSRLMSASHVFKTIIRRVMLSIRAVICVAGVAPSTATASSGGGPDFAAIDSNVSGSLAGTPGFALSIVHGDQVKHVKGFGVADANGSPVTADTPFVLGSESKPIAALGIMQLRESGALDLDAPVQRYLPWFQVADPGYSTAITIRQLLNQTSGLPPSTPFETSVTSVESRVRDLATVKLPAPPGRLYQYSNSNYDTLGLVIEAVSGQSYADYMQEHVFAPLSMTHTHASEAAAKHNGLATGHQWCSACRSLSTTTGRTSFAPAGSFRALPT
jgi:CubicO group peptidase (beta-lactamase class C family)